MSPARLNPVRPLGQRGSILLGVIVVGLLATLSMLTLVDRSAGREARLVEEDLARVRAYWAAMGHIAYGLSRMRQSGGCDDSFGIECANDESRALTMTDYLAELSAERRWRYPEVDAGYYFDLAFAVAPDDAPDRHRKSGHLMITASFPSADASTFGVLAGLSARLRPLELRYCIVRTVKDSCTPVTEALDASQTEGTHRIKRLRRLPAG